MFKHGAHVTSWRDAAGNELLFVSKKALFQPPKAIRGGIPVCWPQFSDFGSLGQHGFARNREWELVGGGTDESGGAFVDLVLRDCEETRAEWPHSFELTLRVVISDAGTLHCDLGVNNTGAQELAFTAALHTYFRCDAKNTTVRGLHGASYLDSLAGRCVVVQEDEAVSFGAEVDRIYLGVGGKPLLLVDATHGRTVAVAASNMPDAVVWNPHVAKAKAMADFGDEEYLDMVCIEPAVVQPAVKLAPGQVWRGGQVLSVDSMPGRR